MTHHQCENGHLGPFVYDCDEELIGSPYNLERHEFVTLICESCWAETQRLTVNELVDILNEVVQLPKPKVTE